jgi:G protein-coupled receptor Mth (Methuselah protein)
MKYLVAILIVFLMTLVASKEVRINKCCRIGDSLNPEKQCSAGSGHEKWAPKIYMPAKGAYYNKTGQLPGFMKANEEIFPQTCKDPELFTGANKFIVMSNGSLFIYEKNVILSPENYCVEKESALVCFDDPLGDPELLVEATKAVGVKKCCGPKQAYHENASIPCVNLDKAHSLYHNKIIENYRVYFSYTFPNCPTNEFAIAGPYMPSNFDPETGDLKTSAGKTFNSNQYCLDYILGDEKVVNIFTCSEHFAKATPLPTSKDQRFAIYSIGLLISVVFLLATLVVSFLFLTNHLVLHWKCQTNYIACLLVGDLLLAITQMSGDAITGGFCIAIGELFFRTT